ncbi:hypothetical protein [Roseivivax isoporae]|uniref:Uncharacterized protein n=1 Tax=Roseivivax isoporae LMG 25204 TaxID=1449351 RepID=X7F768_9RHOB|nr:hypothetical protein [Roseivivax isoporae]ETX28640.1 hypothetical protein RISW2_05970 [Roseivivax isoporae LMG 25204]
MLAHLFPGDAEVLTALGHASGNTRVRAGIHFSSHVAAGREIADEVDRRAIALARADGSGF